MPVQYNTSRLTDRGDGRRIRTLTPVFRLMPYLVRQSGDAADSFIDTVDLTAAERWIRTAQQGGYEHFSLLHLFTAAYVRMISQRPALNRFVVGRRIYARYGIDVVVSSGHSGSADDGAMTVKVHLRPEDTVFDVYRKISAGVDSYLASAADSRYSSAAETLGKTPRFVVRAGAAIVRFADYNGWLGRKFLDRSPFHGSLVISDEGASQLPPVVRSFNTLGAMPLSISLGRRTTVTGFTNEGRLTRHRSADYCVTMDSRIADSSYYGEAFQYFRYYLQHPDELEHAPERVNEDIL